MMRLSQWFDADVKPREVGVYFRDGYGYINGYQFWDGNNWLYGGSIKDAMRHNNGKCLFEHRWRGLASDPNARNIGVDRHEDDTDNYW